MHIGKHDVGAQARAGDEGAAGADKHGGGGIELAHHGGNIGGQEVHHAHDDHLHPAVVTDAGDGALYLVDGAGIPEEVQNHKGAKDHEHDLQAPLDALPEEGVVHGHILLKGGAGDIKVGKSQHQRPYKGHRGHFFWRTGGIRGCPPAPR